MQLNVMETPQRTAKRQRGKRACETCKYRKRRCDGQSPCSFCVRFEYRCRYESHQRKRASLSESITSLAGADEPPMPRNSGDRRLGPQTRSDVRDHELMEANSGMAFPKVLGMKLDPDDPPKVQSFSWNLGLRHEPVRKHTNITQLITREDMEGLAKFYLERLHPMYAFVHWPTLERNIISRWQDLDAIDIYDAVFCGVAALGSLYSGLSGHQRESELIQCAKEMLEATNTTNAHLATAWLLRTIYLRSVSSPHLSWMASCTTMHVMEAIGVHQDPALVSLVYSDTADTFVNEEIQRRLFWVATLLNAWISNEYGRTRIAIRDVSCKDPSRQQGEFTADLIHLYRISEMLDPDQTKDASDLKLSLARVAPLDISYDPLLLSQSILTFTIYRRLRLVSTNIQNEVLENVIRIGMKGLDAAMRMAEARCPWWHVANVPFQFLCILLAIDSRESLSHVGHARRSLEKISDHFNTETLKNAVKTAEKLINISRLSKERDLNLLNDGMHDENARVAEVMSASTGMVVDDEIQPAPDLMTEYPTDFILDWDAVLNNGQFGPFNGSLGAI